MLPDRERRYLETDLLRRVSRSFYLSMQMLPRVMRGPVSLGYLLARISDTLADTTAVPLDLRRDGLRAFRDSIWGGGGDLFGFHARIVRDFLPLQTHAGEAELLRRLPDCHEWLISLDEPNRAAVTDVMDEITAGQTWDLERFDGTGAGELGFVETAEELDRYTYQVAGCVGEFWTRVGFGNLGDRFAAPESEGELMRSGRIYGQGLQLVNILRDLGGDLGSGRCYLPRADLAAAGWTEGKADARESALATVAESWRARCRESLRQGWTYVSRLRRGRVRIGTVLPLILAGKTVDLMDAAGVEAVRRHVKVSRATVWASLVRALWS